MLIGQHIGRFRSELPELLARKDRLAPRHGDHGETILAGRFEATPPDRHMLVAATRCT